MDRQTHILLPLEYNQEAKKSFSKSETSIATKNFADVCSQTFANL